MKRAGWTAHWQTYRELGFKTYAELEPRGEQASLEGPPRQPREKPKPHVIRRRIGAPLIRSHKR